MSPFQFNDPSSELVEHSSERGRPGQGAVKLRNTVSSKDDQGYRIAFTVKSRSAFRLYEQFRPVVPAGAGGWGAKGTLDIEKIEALAQSA